MKLCQIHVKYSKSTNICHNYISFRLHVHDIVLSAWSCLAENLLRPRCLVFVSQGSVSLCIQAAAVQAEKMVAAAYAMMWF